MISGLTDCGIRYAVKRSGSAVGYCALSIRCGTRDETDFSSGIAHFAEHTIFKGTQDKSANVINNYLDRLGGELNAYTTKEEIVIHATVLKEDLGKAASLLFELATRPVFPEKEISKEKGVVIDEILSCKDVPSEDIYDKFEEMLFEGHPLSGPILGTAASVKKITREELLRFVKEKFTPDNMAFTVVADVDEQKMAQRINALSDKFFAGAVSDEGNAPGRLLRTFGRADMLPNIFDKTLNRRSHQANCIIGSTAASLYEEKERVATALMCNILGGPATNSILNSVLREKNGWVYGVECSYTQYADSGIVAVCIGCDKANLERCTRSVGVETAKLQEEMLSERKLKAAKKQFLGQMAISSDNGETQCLSMGKSLLAYGTVHPDEYVRNMIEGVSAGQIRDAAEAVFGHDRLSRLTFI